MKQCLLQNGKEKICYELDNHQIIRSAAKLFFFFSIQVKSTSLHKIRQKPGFLWNVFSRISTESYSYFPVYGQNLRYTGKFGYDCIYMRENTDQKNAVFRHISPSTCRNNFSYVYFNLTLNWLKYICVLYFDLAYFRSLCTI